MLVYLKIAHEVMPIRSIFMVRCGCDVKNPGPAMLVYSLFPDRIFISAIGDIFLIDQQPLPNPEGCRAGQPVTVELI